MIDTHCHLEFPDFDSDRNEVIERAKEKMTAIIDSAADIEKAEIVLQLSEENKNFIFPSLGLHPISALKIDKEKLEKYFKFIRENRKKIVSIGEVGLDFHWIKEKEKQRSSEKVFLEFVGLAKELGLPLVLHSWNAEKEVLEILENSGVKLAVMHCFSGKRELLEQALGLGYFISFSTQICFSKLHKKLAKNTPLERILLETDAPFLSPKKDERNYPWNVKIVVEKLSKIKKLEEKEIIGQTTKNAIDAFNLPINHSR